MVAAAREILGYLTVSRRGLSLVERDKVQRALDPARQNDISTYVTRGEATFPTSITVNADSQRLFIVPTDTGLVAVVGHELAPEEIESTPIGAILTIATKDSKRHFVRLPLHEAAAEIIDGQHRFEGLKKAIRDAADNPALLSRLQAFELTLAVMFDLVPEQSAKVFVTINATQRKVDSSHIADLFALHTARSPQRVCHLIAVSANELDGSPFEGGLKMLGKRVQEGQYLSQGSFIKYLMSLLPRASESGELIEKAITEYDLQSRPFSQLYLDKQDKLIAQIVLDYFTAVADAYPQAWKEDSDNFLIRKTVGFAALVKLLRKLAPLLLKKGTYSYEYFDTIMSTIKVKFPQSEWAVGKFSSSEAEASRVAVAMYEAVREQLTGILSNEQASPVSNRP